jgi:multiple sugar transport system permease protein
MTPLARMLRRHLTPGWLAVWATLGFALCFFGIPLIWLLVAATRSQSSLFTDPPFAVGDWATIVRTWTNLASYNDFQIVRWAVNSAIYSIGGVGLSLVSAIPAGYVLAVYRFPGRRLILILTLIAMITPNQAIVLPLYLEMNLLGLNNTYLGLILATGFFPFGVYLAYIYYASSLPAGILDSARIDGCTRLRLFLKIGLPLARPAIALVAFFSFVASWSNYFLAFVLLSSDDLYNLPLGLTTLISGSGALNNTTPSDIPVRMPEAIQAAILVIAPVLVVFLISQRYVRSGQLSGAVKG